MNSGFDERYVYADSHLNNTSSRILSRKSIEEDRKVLRYIEIQEEINRLENMNPFHYEPKDYHPIRLSEGGLYDDWFFEFCDNNM